MNASQLTENEYRFYSSEEEIKNLQSTIKREHFYKPTHKRTISSNHAIIPKASHSKLSKSPTPRTQEPLIPFAKTLEDSMSNILSEDSQKRLQDQQKRMLLKKQLLKHAVKDEDLELTSRLKEVSRNSYTSDATESGPGSTLAPCNTDKILQIAQELNLDIGTDLLKQISCVKRLYLVFKKNNWGLYGEEKTIFKITGNKEFPKELKLTKHVTPCVYFNKKFLETKGVPDAFLINV